MKKKLGVAILVVSVAIALASYSYACTTGIGDNDCVCAVKFIKVSTNDNEVGNDYAHVSARLVNFGQAVEMTITNGYPGYQAVLIYTIQNKGVLPTKSTSLKLTNPSPDALKIASTDHTGTMLQPSQTVQGTTTVTLLQKAEQGGYYTFKVEIDFVCNEQHPRSVCFWTYQFYAALAKTKCEQDLSPSMLENYLSQITQQSRVFAFTGTQSQKLKQALAILQTTSCSNMEAKLKSQLLALWLNYVAGWTTGYTLDKMTAYQIISGSEDAVIHHLTKQFDYWRNLCERLNDMWDT